MAFADHGTLNNLQFEHFVDKSGGRETTGAISAMHEDREVGSLSWNHSTKFPSGPEIDSVWTHPEYRNRGIATELYHRAGELAGQPLKHSESRTDKGDAWAHSVGGHIPNRIGSVIPGED